MNTIDIHLPDLGTTMQVAGGTTLAQIADSLKDRLGFKPICARVNNKTEGLDYAVYMPKTVRFLDITSDSGTRTYVRSLCMMLYAVLRRHNPDARLKIEHSIAGGYYCIIHGFDPTPKNIDALKSSMRDLICCDHPFVRHQEPVERVIEIFQSQGLDDKVRLLRSTGSMYAVYHTLENVADSYYGCLAPSTSHVGVFDIKPYRDGLLLLPFDHDNPSRPARMIDHTKLFDSFTRYLDFNHIIGVSDVGRLNEIDSRRRMTDLINVAEALHEKYIARISDHITHLFKSRGTRMVLIAGPSSSGKTTFTKRLAIQLRTNLLNPISISLDNYFVDRTLTPRDDSGDYDYESLYALDLLQFNHDLTRLLEGEEVAMPTYNFETGTRSYSGDKVRLEGDSVILLEGIHGLNPELTAGIAEHFKYRIYVSALTTLSIDDHNWVPTTDNRLLRRIVRDFKYRGTSALDTLRRWPSVRRGEERWIFPYQENADAMFNSSLLFELPVIKERALQILARVPETAPEYATAYRLRKFLSYFKPIPEELLPATSLLREFLGGSAFHY